MNEQEEAIQCHCDWAGGPYYQRLQVPNSTVDKTMQAAHRSRVVDVLVFGLVNGEREMRRYFALNLAQAVSRASEIQVRLRELGYSPVILGIRRATDREVDAFFDAINRLERAMPKPVPLTDRAGRAGANQ